MNLDEYIKDMEQGSFGDKTALKLKFIEMFEKLRRLFDDSPVAYSPCFNKPSLPISNHSGDLPNAQRQYLSLEYTQNISTILFCHTMIEGPYDPNFPRDGSKSYCGIKTGTILPLRSMVKMEVIGKVRLHFYCFGELPLVVCSILEKPVIGQSYWKPTPIADSIDSTDDEQGYYPELNISFPSQEAMELFQELVKLLKEIDR